MKRAIEELFRLVSENEISIQQAMDRFQEASSVDLGFAVPDLHRSLRNGFPEVVFGSCKTPEQIVSIVEKLGSHGENVLVTRVSPDMAAKLGQLWSDLEYRETARVMILRQKPVEIVGNGTIAVVTAGTGDVPVAEEACETAELMGNKVERLFDVGVAGLHRLLDRLPVLTSATVVIVVAGMEGALPSVVGGLVSSPVIAVPTSVGYGASFGGVAALLGMLNSCSSGVTVVNIDNGFGAAYAASTMNRIGT